MTTGNDAWRALGDTDLDHYTKSVARNYQGSGVSNMSKEAPVEFRDLQKAGLSRFAAAIAFHETMNGTWPGPIPFQFKNPFAMVAHASFAGHPIHHPLSDYHQKLLSGPMLQRTPHSVANLRLEAEQVQRKPSPAKWAKISDHSMPRGHVWAEYSTYADAVRDWIQVVLDPQGPFKNTTTIKEFIHVYAPSSDGNDEANYVSTVCLILDRDVPLVGPKPTPQPTPPPPTPTPTPPPVEVDPIRVIVGGSYGAIDYGFRSDAGLRYYAYGTGHGTTADTQHTGVDVPVPRGTRLYTPCDGTVLCVGNAGNAGWGNACGSYPDNDGGGASGNCTILFDNGLRLTLGHCSAFNVAVGQKVRAGDYVARSGGMNGPHCHVETAICDQGKVNMRIAHYPGCYFLVEPIQALKDAMGGHVPTVYAERVPLPQPNAWTTFCDVVALVDGVPVLQRADVSSPPVRWPLKRGEHFDAVALIIGDDAYWYWVSSLGSRIPIAGTSAVGGPKVEGAQ